MNFILSFLGLIFLVVIAFIIGVLCGFLGMVYALIKAEDKTYIETICNIKKLRSEYHNEDF